MAGPADAPGTMLGLVVSQVQFDKMQELIKSGIREGTTLLTGGSGRPAVNRDARDLPAGTRRR